MRGGVEKVGDKVQEEQEEKYPDPGIEDLDVEGDGGEKVGLVRCSGCKVVWYCGKVGWLKILLSYLIFIAFLLPISHIYILL